jgi:hypothetical protein
VKKIESDSGLEIKVGDDRRQRDAEGVPDRGLRQDGCPSSCETLLN